MTAPDQDSPDVLCAEILAEARRECEEIIRHAKADAEKIFTDATTEAGRCRREKREQAQAEAAHRKEMILATVAVEAGRLRAARVEELLESVREEIRHRSQRRDFDTREVILALASKALREMPGNDFVLKISNADHAALGDRLTEKIPQRCGTGRMSVLRLTISTDATVSDGVVIQSADGLQIWDNRLASRLERLWPELRRQIAVRAALVGESEAAPNSELHSTPENLRVARERLGLRQSPGAFMPTSSKAAEDCRSPKPGGISGEPENGGA